jgi:hypothetical protein
MSTQKGKVTLDLWQNSQGHKRSISGDKIDEFSWTLLVNFPGHFWVNARGHLW